MNTCHERERSLSPEERQRRRRVRAVKQLVDHWRCMSAITPKIAAYIAVSVATPHDPVQLAAAVRRLAPLWLPGVHAKDRSAWWKSLVHAGSLLALRVALETRLVSGTSRRALLTRPSAVRLIDSWRSLDRLSPAVARQLLYALLCGTQHSAVRSALARLAPDVWRHLPKRGPVGDVWVTPLARRDPFLAVKVGLEAALIHDVNGSVVDWTEALVDVCPHSLEPLPVGYDLAA